MNRITKYGDGFFETILIHNGKIPFFGAHFERILKTVLFFKGVFEVPISNAILETEILDLYTKKGFTTAKVRIQFFRSSEGTYLPDKYNFSYEIEIESTDLSNFSTINISQKVCIYRDNWKTTSPISNFKTSNALIYTLSMFYSSEKGFDQSIILNQNGRIAESSYCNIFIIKNNKIITPPLSEGCVGGAFRNFFIHNFSLLKIDMELKEDLITEEDLKTCDEVFLTSAVRGIVLCHQLDHYTKKTELSTYIATKVKDIL